MDPTPTPGNGHAKNFTTGTLLIDTNVLVYCYDRREPAKQARAVGLIDKLIESERVLLSTQVLSEFFSIALRKLHMTPAAARLRIVEFVDTWNVLDVTAQIVVNAARGVVKHQLSYWDALLWATALTNRIPYILSEDFQDGIRIEGVRVLNPFQAAFDVDRLLRT